MTFVTNNCLVDLLRLPLSTPCLGMRAATVAFAKLNVLSKFLPAMEKMIRVRVTKDAGVVVIMPMMEVTQ